MCGTKGYARLINYRVWEREWYPIYDVMLCKYEVCKQHTFPRRSIHCNVLSHLWTTILQCALRQVQREETLVSKQIDNMPGIQSLVYISTLKTQEHKATRVQHNTTQHNTTQYNTIQHNTTQYSTIQHNVKQHNTTQHNTTQHNTTQHNTTQHNTTQHITTQHITTQHNTTQHNTTWNNRTQHNVKQHNITWNNTIQHNTTQHITSQHSAKTQHNTNRKAVISSISGGSTITQCSTQALSSSAGWVCKHLNLNRWNQACLMCTVALYVHVCSPTCTISHVQCMANVLWHTFSAVSWWSPTVVWPRDSRCILCSTCTVRWSYPHTPASRVVIYTYVYTVESLKNVHAGSKWFWEAVLSSEVSECTTRKAIIRTCKVFFLGSSTPHEYVHVYTCIPFVHSEVEYNVCTLCHWIFHVVRTGIGLQVHAHEYQIPFTLFLPCIHNLTTLSSYRWLHPVPRPPTGPDTPQTKSTQTLCTPPGRGGKGYQCIHQCACGKTSVIISREGLDCSKNDS